MPLIVEDGSNVANANSYISLADANAYFDTRLNSGTWTGETDANKERALMDATRSLDESMEWIGYRTNEDQVLEWPRSRVPDDTHIPIGANVPWAWGAGTFGSPPFTGIGQRYYDSNAIPKRLKDAVCEQAIEMMKRDRTAEWSALGIDRVGLGSGALDVSFSSAAAATQVVIPDRVSDILLPFGVPFRGHVMAKVRR